MFRFTSTQLLLLLTVTSSRVWQTNANRDDTYYAEGVVNPNTVHNAMYWKEPSNVLQDLDKFEKLYVQYHECAWSEILGQNNNGGGGGDESDTWYLKSVPRMGAQVAYTLHGVLAGHRDRGCSKATYIMSAHTSNGITGFTNVLANIGVDGFTAVQNGGEGDHQENNNDGNGQVTSNCQSQGGQQGGHRILNEGQQQQQGDDEKYYYEYNSGSSSVGAICENKKFVQAQISGSTCSGTVEQVLDEYTEFNTLLSNKAKCVQIYAKGDSTYSQEDGQQQGNNGNSSPLSLLSNSYSCWYQQSDCPDPYGKQRKYQQTIDRATSSNLSVQDQETKARAATFLLLSVAFLVGAVYLLLTPGRGGSMPPGYLERIKSRRRASRKIKRILEIDENGSKSNPREWSSPDIAQTMSQEVSLAPDESQSAYSFDEQSQRAALSTDTSNDDSSAYPRPPPTHLWQDDQQEAMARRKGF